MQEKTEQKEIHISTFLCYVFLYKLNTASEKTSIYYLIETSVEEAYWKPSKRFNREAFAKIATILYIIDFTILQ